MKNKVFRRFLRRKVSVVAAIILLTIILAEYAGQNDSKQPLSCLLSFWPAYSARCLSPPIPWSRIF